MKRSTSILILFLGFAIAHAQNQKAKDYFNASEVHMTLMEHDKAIEKLDLAIKEDNKYADANFRRGIYYYKLDRHDLAEKDFLSTIKLDPNNARTYFYLGEIKEKNGDSKKMMSHYKKIHTVNKETAKDYAIELIAEAESTYNEYSKNGGSMVSIIFDSEEVETIFYLIYKAILIDP